MLAESSIAQKQEAEKIIKMIIMPNREKKSLHEWNKWAAAAAPPGMAR